jgi:hypothetical protein
MTRAYARQGQQIGNALTSAALLYEEGCDSMSEPAPESDRALESGRLDHR